MRDNRYWLVGPFRDRSSAGEWGSDPANNPEDDHRWQIINLDDARRDSEPAVFSPDQSMQDMGKVA